MMCDNGMASDGRVRSDYVNVMSKADAGPQFIMGLCPLFY